MQKPVYIFSGLGAQWAGMGRSLYHNQPLFRQTFERFHDLFQQSGCPDLITTLLQGDEARLQCSATAHRLTFSYQAAYVELLRAAAITPGAVLGHSSGEVAAAWCAGILTDADAVTLVEAHCRLIEAVKNRGAMLYAALDEGRAEDLRKTYSGISIAAWNSHAAIVISGDSEDIELVQKQLEQQKIFCRRPRTSIAFHSAHLDPHLERFARELAALTPGSAACAYYSALTGDLYSGPWNAEYWQRHIRQPVRFHQAFAHLLEQDEPDTLVEIAPQSLLGFDMRTDLVAGQSPGRLLVSADGELDEARHYRQLLADLETQPTAVRADTPEVGTTEEIESRLLTVLAEITGQQPDFDADSTWLDLGITSAQILALSTRLTHALGRAIPPDLFFRYPRVAEFARALPHGGAQSPTPGETQRSREAREPVAVIGMAFHLPPDLTTVEELQAFLQRDTSAVTDAPADRPWLQGEKAAFLQRDIWTFDAPAFQISAGEASELDPQQRLLLEIARGTLEDANIPPSSLRGKDVGVYLGISTDDFKEFSYRQPEVSPYTATGNMFNTASGRISYCFDFQGPSVSIDTACSSSLVAIHQACQALRNGDCSLALAGGVNLILSPRLFASMRAIGALSPTATCHAFNADANGYVRGEGCALLLLKPLSAAVADKNRIHAVIRGSAVNQDGRSNGLTAPSGAAQTRLVRQALDVAGVSANDISVIETHGTGTPLGDPIEAAALAEAFHDRDRALSPIVLGALKSRLGHLEACAGVAGLIKVIADLRRGAVSGIRGLSSPSSHIDWQNIPLAASAQPTPLPGRPLLAGISSFGYSGTNAHVVIAMPEAATQAPETEISGPLLWALSATSEDALRRLAARYVTALDAEQLPWHAGISKTQLSGRDQHPWRAAMVTTDKKQLRNKLEALAGGREPVRACGRQRGRVAMLLPGQGTQYVAMGADLYRQYQAFRSGFDECAAVCAARGYEIKPVVYPDGETGSDAPDIDASPYAQLSYFCFASGAFRLWHHWGVRPDLLIGHSLGEYIAAGLAGVMSLNDTVDLICKRGELTSSLPVQGRMMTVFCHEATLDVLLAEFPAIDLAVVNSPEQLVVAGSAEDLDALACQLRQRRIDHKPLAIHFASHSRFIEPALEPFHAFCRTLTYAPPRIPVLSNLTGRLFGEEQPFSARYWQEHLRQPVNFSRCLQTAVEMGIDAFIEIGPSSVLTSLIRQQTAAADFALVTTASRSRAGLGVTFEGLKELYLKGFAIDWPAVFQPFPQPLVDLPATPGSRLHRYLPEGFRTMQQPLHASTAAGTPPADERSDNLDALIELVHTITWKDRSDIDPAANLLDLGLDSLMLVQLRQQIEKTFQVSITLAQLYEELNSLDKIAQKLKKKVSVPVAAPVADTALKPFSLGVAGDELITDKGVSALMQQQIDTLRQVFDQQLTTLQALQGTGSASVATREIPPDCPLSAGSGFRSMRLQEDPLSPEQKAFIAAFSRRFNDKTGKSKKEAQKHRTQLADWIKSLGYKQSIKELIYPIIARQSQGAHFTDIDGNHYIDIAMGYGVGFLGHRHPQVVAAVEEQLRLGFELGPQSLLAGEIADLVCQLTGVERVAFCGSGSEAVMVSLRLARAVTGRRKIVIFANSYHGTYDSVLAVDMDGVTHPAAAGVPGAMVADVLVLHYGDEAALERIAEVRDELAAVLVEPVQSRKPDLVPVAFLKDLRELTRTAGIPLIFDETITGFRMHPGGAQHLFDIRADMVIYGKAVGGGLPLSLICGDKRYLDAIDGGSWNFGDNSHPGDEVTFFGGTYLKHPLALAATRAGLRFIAAEGPQLQERVNALLSYLAEEANAFFTAEQVPLKLVHYGSMFRFEGLGRYSLSLNPLEIDLFFYLLMDRGVYTWEKRICFLSVAHTRDDMDRILSAIKESVRELRAGGFPFALKPDSTKTETSSHAPDTAFPLASAQQRLYVFDQLSECKTLYNLPLAFVLDTPPSAKQLEKAINTLIRRHPVLTTAFTLDRRHPLQQYQPTRTLTLEQNSIDTESIDAVVDNFVRPFDLEKDLLLRAGLFTLKDDRALLVFDFHHLVADGLALNTFLQELGLLLDGRELPEPKARSYADFVAAEESFRRSPEYPARQDFWLKQFDPPVPPLNLQGGRPRPEFQDYLGDNLFFTIAPDLTAHLKQSARAGHVSLFSLLLAAFAVLLQRCSGESRLCVGIPVDVRSAEDRGAAGMFANTLPLVLDLDPEVAFADLVHRVQTRFLEAYEQGRYPLDDLIRQLQLPRDLGRNPLFDVMFIYENGRDRGVRLGESFVAPYPYNKQTAMFDVTLEVIDLGDELQCRFEYATTLFTRETLSLMATRLEQLLRAVVDKPQWALRQFDLLTAAEQERLRQLNATRAPWPEEATIPRLWRQCVARSPESTALVCCGTDYSRRWLDETSDALAAALIRQLQPAVDDRIALFMERSPYAVAALLAILKTGAAYVPVSMEFPPERRNDILDDSGARGVVVSRAYAADSWVKDCLLPVIVAEDGAAQPNASAITPPGELAPHHLAYIMFTSGSTGKPKGVMISHGNVISMTENLPHIYKITDRDTLLAVTTLTFDISVLEIISCLLTGTRIVLATEDDNLDIAPLAELMRKHEVTAFQTTPSRLKLLLQLCGEDTFPDSLRTLLVGGEAFPDDLFARLKDSPFHVFNVYGPTETTIWSTSRLINGTSRPLIGTPLLNEQVYLLDRLRQPVAPGMVGELFIGGAGVGRGYINRPELTAAKFVTPPWDSRQTIYATGDLARLTEEGCLEFLGRSDDQIKLHGYRIELQEIENCLATHAAIALAAVTTITAADSSEVMDLAAYYTLQPQATPPSVDDLRGHLARNLPPYMVPGFYTCLEQMPLNTSGKIDRKALPSPSAAATAGAEPEPASPLPDKLEALLLTVFAEVLDRPDLDPEDNFFVCGGDSVRAVLIVARGREQGLSLRVRDIFTHPTVRSLAHWLQQQSPAGDTPSSAGATSSGDSTDSQLLPLTTTQQGMLFHSLLDPLAGAYINQARCTLHGPVRADELHRMVDALGSRHAMLRATVVLDGEAPRQRIDAGTRPLFQQLTLSAEDPEALTAKLDELAAAERAAIQLTDHSPLMRLLLVRCGPARRELIWTFHHLLVDGWSIGILLKEAAAFLRGSGLPRKKADFPDFIAWCRHQDSAATEGYRQDVLRDAPPPILLADATADTGSFASESRQLQLTTDLTAQLAGCCARCGVTLNSLFLCAWALTLAEYGRQHEGLIGATFSGRPEDLANMDEVVGLFITSLPVPFRIQGRQTLRDLARALQETVLAATGHQQIDLAQLRQSTGNPLFDHLLIFENYPLEEEAKKLLSAPEAPPRDEAFISNIRFFEHTHYPLEILVFPHGGTLGITFTFDSRRIKVETIDRLAEALSFYLGCLATEEDGIAAAILDSRMTQGAASAAVAAKKNEQTPLPSAGSQVQSPEREEDTRTMAGLFARALDLPAVAADDDFFSRGGHSLKVVRLAGLIQQQLGWRPALKAVYQHPTPRLLAAHLAVAREGAPAFDVRPYPPADHDPLSEGQKGLWLHQQVQKDSVAYNTVGAFVLEGPLNTDFLEEAFRRAIRRHAALRTRFITIQGEPRQVIVDDLPFTLDIRPVAATADPLADIREQIRTALHQPFALEQLPLFRVSLYVVDAQRSILSLIFHHIVSDGWSDAVLARDISHYYHQVATGSDAPLPPLTIHYRDYARSQQDYLGSASGATERDYWRERLRDLPVPAPVLHDSPRPQRRAGHGARTPLTLSPQAASVRHLATAVQATPFAVLHAVIKVLLHSVTGSRDLTIGVPSAQRPTAATQDLVGYFLNLLPLRSELDPEQSFEELVQQLHEDTLRDFQHQNYPFGGMVDDLQVEKSFNQHPLFDIMLLFHNNASHLFTLDGVTCSPFYEDSITCRFDLDFEFFDDRDFDGFIEYDTELYRPQTVEKLAQAVSDLCRDCCRTPAAPIADLSRACRLRLDLDTSDLIAQINDLEDDF